MVAVSLAETREVKRRSRLARWCSSAAAKVRVALFGQRQEHHSTIGRTGHPLHQAVGLEPVGQTRHATGGERHPARQLRHRHAATLGAGDAQQHLERLQGDAGAVLEVGVELPGELGVGLEQETERADPGVVHPARRRRTADGRVVVRRCPCVVPWTDCTRTP